MLYRAPAPRRLLLSALLLGLAACRGVSAEVTGGLAADLDGCRSYSEHASVQVGALDGELRCSFDAAALELRCEIQTEAGRHTSVASYASVADFVEAGRSVGKLTSLRERRHGGVGALQLVHGYDELGRLVRSREEGAGGSSVTRYADHDELGRPRRGLTERSGELGCALWHVRLEYSDAELTVMRRSWPADPARCGFGELTRVERFDAAGNPLGAAVADGTGVRQLWSMRAGASTARVCL